MRGSEAVRRDVREDPASDRRVRRLSHARKQTAAEMLELRVIFLLTDYNNALEAGDAAGVAAAKAQIRSWIRTAFEIDLKRVKLTRKRLVPR